MRRSSDLGFVSCRSDLSPAACGGWASLRRPAFRTAVVVSMWSMSCFGCGRVGAIRPPEATAPAPVKQLTAQGRVDGVLLTWQSPTEDATGGNLKSLDRFFLQRSDYVKGEVPDFATIAEVAPPEAEKKKVKSDDEQASGADSKKSGPSNFGINLNQKQKLTAPLTYLDNTAVAGHRYDYRVLGVTENGVKGSADLILRVTFAGEATRVENVAVALPKTSR